MMLKIMMRGFEFAIEVGAHESILEIKKKIELLLNVPMETQTLSIWGFELIDGLDIDDYPYIDEGTKIDLNIKSSMPFFIEKSSNKLQITVKWLARKIDIEVDRTETVGSLKQKIHRIIFDGTTPITRLGLLFAGFQLENDLCYLTDYRISDYSEIEVFHTNNVLSSSCPRMMRVLSIIVQTSSSLLNGAKIPLVLSDSSSVFAMKQMLLSRNILPLDDYIFIHNQSIMRENCSLRWHGVENGGFLYVFKGTVSPGR